MLRPSEAVLGVYWAVLEASWGHLSRLGGHLGRLGSILEAILGHLGAMSARKTFGNHLWESLEDPPGTPAGRAEAPGGVLWEKEPKPNRKKSSTPGTPVMNQQGAADLVAFGPSRHRA